jgi:6-phosphogluconolactonase
MATEIVYRRFDSYSALEREALSLLTEQMGLAAAEPHAVILTGGRTPMGLYDHIRRRPFKTDPLLHVMLSDERYVSVEAPRSNFGTIRPMLEALGVPASAILRVRTDLPFESAAERYHQDLSAFLRTGRITLALLGLGADGHVASIFRAEDVLAGAGIHALAVQGPDGERRVTITRDLLLKAERIVFLVTGRRKADAVDRLRSAPEKVVAGQVIEGAPWVELWHTKDEGESLPVLGETEQREERT